MVIFQKYLTLEHFQKLGGRDIALGSFYNSGLSAFD